MKYYQKSLPIKNDEYQDLIELKLGLEQKLKKPITIRDLTRTMIKFAKNKIEDPDFLKELENVLNVKSEKIEEDVKKKGIIERIRKGVFK
ncbi:MAG: hypothetical protein RMJ18_00615 [Candidatus Aenigmarchaeota archaeon]|nr:hypothetical protein [Candidatus Aenigmarchaeota archaeon]MCS7123066.1 hypothetical protein [Candidatus Aenigmarchaeota archaeon]MDW8149088.1 hypothetical protein [Candidatus Aenigmarchaeota archaeon]MDW8159912.1 hypothetical protein [Candidatus Aenigmarchaeota archaeon]